MVSLFNSLIGWLFRASIIKFVIFTAIAVVLTPLMALLMSLVNASGLNAISGLFDALPVSIKYFLWLLKFEIGVPLLVAAYLTRFFIRRLPIVG